MIEVLPTVWISKRAIIEENIIFGRNIIIWGNTVIKANSIIESNVEIGHPSYKELNHKNISKDVNALLLYNKYIFSKTTIEEKSNVRSGSIIYSNVQIGAGFDCAHNVIIREDCEIGENCYLAIGTQLKTEILIKNNVRLAGTIADRTVIGNNVSSLGHLMHSYKEPVGGLIEYGPILEDYVTVGREASVIGNIKLGYASYISAGSIVRTNIKPYALVIEKKSKILKNSSPLIKFLKEEKNDKKI